jgi:membrane protease subunit (stomatin/prohibitin family)
MRAMPTLQRPGEAAPALFWKLPPAPVPPGTQLVVDPSDCVVVSFRGAVLGVISPGTHVLGAQSFPFLAPSVDASSGVTAEFWFVRTSPYRGLQFGGSLGKFHDTTLNLDVTPLVTGEYSLTVVDPARFVQASMAMNDANAVTSFVSAAILRAVKEVYGEAVANKSVLQTAQMTQEMIGHIRGRLGELASSGMSMQIGSLNIRFSDAEREALKAANAVVAREARQAYLKNHPGDGGGATAAPLAAPPAQPAPARKSRTGLLVGLGLAAVLVLGALVAVALHFTQGSSEHAREAPAHEAKHGKH